MGDAALGEHFADIPTWNSRTQSRTICGIPRALRLDSKRAQSGEEAKLCGILYLGRVGDVWSLGAGLSALQRFHLSFCFWCEGEFVK